MNIHYIVLSTIIIIPLMIIAYLIIPFSMAESESIKNVCLKPGKLFDFPESVECSNSKSHFVRDWLKRFPWLAHTKFHDGAFCSQYVLFGVQYGRNNQDKSLRTSAMSHFTKHASRKCEMHNFSVIASPN